MQETSLIPIECPAYLKMLELMKERVVHFNSNVFKWVNAILRLIPGSLAISKWCCYNTDASN